MATALDKNDCGEVDDKEEAVKAAVVGVFLKLKFGIKCFKGMMNLINVILM